MSGWFVGPKGYVELRNIRGSEGAREPANGEIKADQARNGQSHYLSGMHDLDMGRS